MDGTDRATTPAIRIASMLLLAASVLALLGGCGGGGGGGGGEEEGGGETTAAEQTGGGETTAAGGETTAAGGETTAAGGETTAAGGETTAARGEITTAEFAATNVSLLPSRNSGVVGNANITDTPGGVEVALDVQGLQTQPDTEHVAHIHEGGTCADDRAGNGAPILYPLDPLLTQGNGTATSATSLEGVTLEQLTSGAPKYVNVHAEPTGEGVPPGVACADLPGTGGGEATTGAAGGGETTASG